MVIRRRNAIASLFTLSLITAVGRPCSVIKVISNVDLVSTADAVIRAKAIEYATPPSDPNIWTTGVPDSKVRFKMMEVIRGFDVSDLVLSGYLVRRDDFNDQQHPIHLSDLAGALAVASRTRIVRTHSTFSF